MTEYMVFDISYYPIAVASFLFFLAIYIIIVPVLSPYLFESYCEFTEGQKKEWDTRIGSTIHAAVIFLASMYIVFFDPIVNEDPVWGDSPFSRQACAFVIGYMIADTVLMIIYHKYLGDTLFYIHHLLCFLASFFVTSYGLLAYFASFRMISELSTPFINQRWYFHILNYPKGSFYVLGNGFLMAVTFFLSRVAIMPIYWHRLYHIYGTPAYLQMNRIAQYTLQSGFILDALNVFWCGKIWIGLYKHIKRLNVVSTTDGNKNVIKETN